MTSVDIVIPNYRYGRFLPECIGSVLAQDIAELRVLVIDNASDDDSVEIVQELARRDPRIELRARRTNLGPHASFNEGIDWARAEYMLILCADDMLAPGALGRSTAIMDAHRDTVLSTGTAARYPHAAAPEHTDAAGWRVYPGRVLIERFCETAVCHVAGCTALVRTAAQKQAGYYRSELPHTDDVEMWMRVALLGSVAETDAVQGIMRVHAGALSAPVRDAHWRDLQGCSAAFESFFAHEGDSIPDCDRLRNLMRRSIGARAYWSSLAHLARGRRADSSNLMAFALSRSPRAAFLPPLGYLLRRHGSARAIGGAIGAALRRNAA